MLSRTTALLDTLRQHTDSVTSQPREHVREYTISDEIIARKLLREVELPIDLTPLNVAATLKAEIVRSRAHLTTTSRVVEREVSRVLASSTLPPAVLSSLFGKMVTLFDTIRKTRNLWLPDEIDVEEMQILHRTGNHRQQFHALRDFLAPLQTILARLATTNTNGDPYLSQLGHLGVLNPSYVLHFVSNAAGGKTSEILSPPEELRQVWKRVANERQAPEDKGQFGPFTANLWQTEWRVKDATMPPVSKAEVEAVFGAHATISSSANLRLPYFCGANKYRLVENDPIVVDATERGFHMTSGPSGTAYRFLSMWLTLGGDRRDLETIRLGAVTLLLNGNHHSVMEAMLVCAPLVGCKPPNDLTEMLKQLVPHDLKLVLGNVQHCLTAEEFDERLARRLEDLVA
ncbi:hypothetical protein GLAREA_05005 [Glarea lozoyensis ATCC 20868]|uniref:Uncharacterized protein n=1 Tax=Glarea lozoyensis (strain ATCC 20868 / MF5171) TaxID=1116229 RepID=S3CT25_GLAL2|nr:uncharacterized protein GLAREA_05005 [Glarea lozoyensis ATCC 20868]EPE28214.1 hypothetical protein GLAREA_05005 [Glarea lozoyensis ATCC 20868]